MSVLNRLVRVTVLISMQQLSHRCLGNGFWSFSFCVFFGGKLLSGAYHKKQALWVMHWRSEEPVMGLLELAELLILVLNLEWRGIKIPLWVLTHSLLRICSITITLSVYPALAVEGVSGAGRPYLRDMVLSRHAVPCRHVTACHPLRAPTGSASPLPLASCLQPWALLAPLLSVGRSVGRKATAADPSYSWA